MDAETIGGTTGISHPPKALSGLIRCRVNIRYGTARAHTRPRTVPPNQSTQSMSTANRTPTTSLPNSSAPAPTVSMAIGTAP